MPYRQITSVSEYRFDDIRPGDRVLDIGANVGGFCIRAARIGGQVTAVEPVTTAPLLENIRANNVSVQVIAGALGNGKPRRSAGTTAALSPPRTRSGTLSG